MARDEVWTGGAIEQLSLHHDWRTACWTLDCIPLLLPATVFLLTSLRWTNVCMRWFFCTWYTKSSHTDKIKIYYNILLFLTPISGISAAGNMHFNIYDGINLGCNKKLNTQLSLIPRPHSQRGRQLSSFQQAMHSHMHRGCICMHINWLETHFQSCRLIYLREIKHMKMPKRTFVYQGVIDALLWRSNPLINYRPVTWENWLINTTF